MRILITTLAACLLISCTDNKKKEIDQLSEEVIMLHDEVMPLMDGLYQTRIKLQKLAASDSMSMDSMTLVTVIANIKHAEDHMMNWMRNFNPGYEGANSDETIQYLLDQKNAIEVVGKQMQNAENAGLQILREN